MSKRIFLLAILLAAVTVGAAAQDPAPSRPGARQTANPHENGSGRQDIGMPEEMRVRLAIERAEGEHRKFLEDVKKLDDLSVEVAKQYKERGSLSGDDYKKLATIEKLARRVLSHAGGREVEDAPSDTARLSVSDAVEQLGTAAANIKKSVITETRHVVSATVVENSNTVISRAQLLRRNQK